jgi:hypothetical protein
MMSLQNFFLCLPASYLRMVQFFIMALLLFSASESSGQTLPSGRILPQIPSGQILVLIPSLSLSERYDDSIFQDDTDEETDFVTIVTPGILLQYQPASETLLELDYRADIEFFAQNTDQNQIGHRGTLSFSSPITPSISITASDNLIITEEPDDRFVEIDDVTGLRPTSQENRQQTIRNRANARLEALLSARSTLSLLFNSLIEDVEEADEVDEFRYTLGAELGYLTDIRRENRLRLFYDVTLHNFSENAPLSPGASEEPDFQVHTFNVGYLHAFSPTLAGDAAVGYAMSNSDDAAEDDHAAFIANLGPVKTLRDGRIALRYRRSLTSGRGEGGNVLADTFTLTIASVLTPKITAAINTNLSFFDFLSENKNNDDQTFWIIRPTLAYQMLHFLRLSFDYSFSITDYNIATRADRTEHLLTFASQFTIREALFLSLIYQYRTRQFSGGNTDGDNQFNRNQVMLTVTYAPTFLFGR